MSYQFGHVDRDDRIELAADEPYENALPHWQIPRSAKYAAVAAGFIVSMWASFVYGTHHPAVSPSPSPGDQAPLVRADEQPVKVKPERPGGMDVPDRDKLIYSERPGGPPVERLLPPAEKPEPRPAAPPLPTASATPAPAAAAPAPAQLAPAPRSSAPQAPPREAQMPKKPAPAATGHIRIQVASVRSPEAAHEEWARLKHRFPDLLGRLSANAVRLDLGDRGIYYRIEAGGFATTAAAAHLCSELKRRDVGCHIVR